MSAKRTADTATEAIPASGPQTTVQRFRLEVLEGDNAGAAFSSTADRTSIGTHRSADLVLDDKTVSRFHCEIVWDDERAVVRDLGSRNGTHVDSVSVVEAHLRDGAVLTLGRSRLSFVLGADRVPIQLSDRERFGRLVGRSTAMRAAFHALERAAASDATVLIEGETGTGKEAAAESIHTASARADGPFIVVDCGSLPPQLLESELFGHERGAFTGAVSARTGAFEAADGGTVFLDEIGELGLALQPKLLRVLERREIKRLGQNHYTPIDVRVIAATHRNLRERVNTREFRSDLYYRLAVLPVRLPALRARRDDLPGLVEHLLRGLGATPEQASRLRTPDFNDSLRRHDWPGNVRELRNHVERCLVLEQQLSPGDPGAQDAPSAVELDRPLKLAREAWSRAFERRYLERLLARCDGNVSAAAREAEVDRMYLYRLLWRHGLK